MPKTFDIQITIVPPAGALIDKTVTVVATATVADVAKAAGIEESAKKNFYVDGKLATPETRVTSKSTFKVTERPAGS